MAEKGLASLMPWIPTVITLVTIVGGGALAYGQIGDNEEAIQRLVIAEQYAQDKAFARDARIKLAADIQDLSESIDENEDAIEDLERSDLQAAGDIKLEIERLRTQQQTLSARQTRELEALSRQLELILQFIEREGGGTPNPFPN